MSFVSPASRTGKNTMNGELYFVRTIDREDNSFNPQRATIYSRHFKDIRFRTGYLFENVIFSIKLQVILDGEVVCNKVYLMCVVQSQNIINYSCSLS